MAAASIVKIFFINFSRQNVILIISTTSDFFNNLEHAVGKTVSGTPCPARLRAILSCRTSSAKGSRSKASSAARHLFAKATCKFSPENLWDKMPRRAFYPAFQGSEFIVEQVAPWRARHLFAESNLQVFARKLVV